MPPLPLEEIEAAAARLAPYAVETPFLRVPALEERLGRPVRVKCENLQRTGSFKFRGAFNAIGQLSAAERQKGVVAFSSGNHAQGVADAARVLGLSAVIVMPADAPQTKTRRTAAYGAKVVPYDRYKDDRSAIAKAISLKEGRALITPYDDPRVMAGQGTIGLEIADKARTEDFDLETLLVPCGGGGLIAGVSSALAHRMPAARCYAVEPEGFDDTIRSLEKGVRVENDPAARSICDAILIPAPGENTFPINRETLAGGFAVPDDAVREAMAFAFREMKLVVEPGGAVALAAALRGLAPGTGPLGLVLSGGNVDEARLFEALERFPA